MSIGKTSFSKIIGIVGRKKTHRISSRAGSLRDRRLQRLKKLGVRSHASKVGLMTDIPREYEKVYNAAYEALKKSHKSWATESEIRAILYNDKEMSRQRSAEVIELLRKSNVPGFKETDEVTPGDVYSERIINVLGKREKTKLRKQREETIKKVMDKDTRAIDTMGIDPKKTGPEESKFDPAKIVSLHSSKTKPTTYEGSKKQDKRLFSAEELEDFAQDFKKEYKTKQHKKSVLESKKRKVNKENEEEEDEEKKVPMRYDLDEFV